MSNPHSSSKHSTQQGFIKGLVFLVFLGCLVAFGFYAYALNRTIVHKFEHRRWDMPARVYSRPLILEVGQTTSLKDTKRWLDLLHYNPSNTDSDVNEGSYVQHNNTLTIHTRSFNYGNNEIDPKRTLTIAFKGNKIVESQSSQAAPLRLEPIEIGRIHPDTGEDREFIALKDTPTTLTDALIATEDRSFYEHYGVSVRSIARAVFNNLKGGGLQGGSTLTQQLVKNFYLNDERSLKRKLNEAVMALLLERNYSKDAILQVYLNEIHLGQNGNQSVNGFGLAARFYFNKPLAELSLDQQALLVGLAKGASYYNPRKHPERAKSRRDLVLKNMLTTGKITQEQHSQAVARPLDVVKVPAIAKTRFADFMDYTRRELNERYAPEQLKTLGLRIITTLDPIAQLEAENALKTQLAKHKKPLQGAIVSADPKTGEVLALIGSSDEFTGFNRAIDAKRQVGSLLKPVVYLGALHSERYNLASGVMDEAQSYGGWTPKNYDGQSHGIVPLSDALAHSYNQAAVNVGMDIGLAPFLGYLKQFGVDDDIPSYPSVLLGAVDLSPMQVLGIYQVFANAGEYSPLYGIGSVIDEKGKVLEKTQNPRQARIDASSAYLLHYALHQVIEKGTAQAAKSLGNLNLGGKTGTTNDAKDAWFAGYSGNYVSVVWVGRDDNKPIGLTGGKGALPIWIAYMKNLHLSPVFFDEPKDIQMTWVENGTGRATTQDCPNAVYIPAKAGTVSMQESLCQSLSEPDINDAIDSEGEVLIPEDAEPPPMIPSEEVGTF